MGLHRSKVPAALVPTLSTVATEALNAQIKAEKRAAEMETARDVSASMLSQKIEELGRATTLSIRLQEICRELQKQNKLVRQIKFCDLSQNACAAAG
jgi:hypothetical protein